jgi:hypothetical protein
MLYEQAQKLAYRERIHAARAEKTDRRVGSNTGILRPKLDIGHSLEQPTV